MAPKKKAPSRPVVTAAQRIAAIIGDDWMTIDEVADVFEALNEGKKLHISRVRAQVRTVLVSSTSNVEGPDGLPLRYSTGGRVKAHIFACDRLGYYRVTTSEERHQEAQRLLEQHAAPRLHPIAINEGHEGPATVSIPPKPLPNSSAPGIAADSRTDRRSKKQIALRLSDSDFNRVHERASRENLSAQDWMERIIRTALEEREPQPLREALRTKVRSELRTLLKNEVHTLLHGMLTERKN